MKNEQAFTLIELLVVVLIIGILAAVAVPQYQKAVIKTKYNTLKTLVSSIATAQEVYFLANNNYAESFEELAIDLPAGQSTESTSSKYIYPWGNCKMYLNGNNRIVVACTNDMIHMQYRMVPEKGSRDCWVLGASEADMTNYTSQTQICQQETGRQTSSGKGTEAESGQRYWRYEY